MRHDGQIDLDPESAQSGGYVRTGHSPVQVVERGRSWQLNGP
jgi:hypothetical protein